MILQILPHKEVIFFHILVMAQCDSFQRTSQIVKCCQCVVVFDLELKSVASGFWPVFYVREAQNC